MDRFTFRAYAKYCGKPGFLSKLDFFIKLRFQLRGGLRCQCKAHTVGQHESLFDYIISTNVSVFAERFVKAGGAPWRVENCHKSEIIIES